MTWARFGSAQAGLAPLRGDGLRIEPSIFELGAIADDQARELRVRIINLTGRTISVYGLTQVGQQDGCLRARHEFPLDLPLSPHPKTQIHRSFKTEPQHIGVVRCDSSIRVSTEQLRHTRFGAWSIAGQFNGRHPIDGADRSGGRVSGPRDLVQAEGSTDFRSRPERRKHMTS